MERMECQNCGSLVAVGLWRRTGGYCADCDLMTIREAARRLHISLSSFYLSLREGRIKGVHPSPGRTLIRRSEVETLLG
jgi:excisionase family DNA binding protein